MSNAEIDRLQGWEDTRYHWSLCQPKKGSILSPILLLMSWSFCWVSPFSAGLLVVRGTQKNPNYDDQAKTGLLECTKLLIEIFYLIVYTPLQSASKKTTYYLLPQQILMGKYPEPPCTLHPFSHKIEEAIE